MVFVGGLSLRVGVVVGSFLVSVGGVWRYSSDLCGGLVCGLRVGLVGVLCVCVFWLML